MCFYNECGSVIGYTESIRKARKPHRCDECRAAIEQGSLYVNGSGIGDDGPFSLKLCGACESTRHRIHLHELEEKCGWEESWCPVGELLDYCTEAEFQRSTAEEGQAFLSQKQTT